MIFYFSEGRLGNQLFQYAFLVSIAKKNEKIIAYGMDQFIDLFMIHNQQFSHIKLKGKTRCLIREYVKPFVFRWLVRFKIIGHIQQNRKNQRPLPSYTEQKGLLPITFVDYDFFQSEAFFNNIKLDIEIKQDLYDEAKNIYDGFPADRTKIFVQVRRGDYLNQVYMNERGIQLPVEYYLKAMETIKEQVENPFFIFLSDDIEFVQYAFQHIEPKYISTHSMGVDLGIMSLCEYGIGSNSTFAWWGGYFMQNKKMVIFPKYWYGWKQKIESHIGIQPSWSDVIEIDYRR